MLVHAFWTVPILQLPCILFFIAFHARVFRGSNALLAARVRARCTLAVLGRATSRRAGQEPAAEELLAARPPVQLPLDEGAVRDLVQVAGGPGLQEDLVVQLLALAAAPRSLGEERLQGLRILVGREDSLASGAGQLPRDDVVEEAPHWHGRPHHALAEEVVHVHAVPLQEVQRLRMVTLHRLRDVDDEELPVEVQHVVLRQVPMDQPAPLHDTPHRQCTLAIQCQPFVGVEPLYVFQPRGRIPILADKPHHKHVLPQFHHLRAVDTSSSEALQVPHLLLGPLRYHLPGIALAVPMAEAILALDVARPVLEDQHGRLVHFHGELHAAGGGGVVDICLLAGAHAAMDLLEHPTFEELAEHEHRSRVKHLLHCCPCVPSQPQVFRCRRFLFGLNDRVVR
mmetsp:Transcript_3671/g.11536  ORF Transcript_3671/g.11536 Transcript_3671/m.11536 type:complete len:397 (+) Transcript_3671:361-1551(+)